MYHLPFLDSYVFVNKEFKIFYHCAFFQKKILSIRVFFCSTHIPMVFYRSSDIPANDSKRMVWEVIKKRKYP